MIAFVLTAVVSLLGLSMFTKLRQTRAYVLLPLFFSVYIPCSIVVLVPIDLVSSSANGKSSIFYLSEYVRLVLCPIIYWMAFFLTWAVLPILQSFVESGYHSTAQRLKDSAKRNLRYQLIMLGSGLIGLVYVIVSSGLSISSIKSLLVALSHSYALVIAIWLMGHGLVNLPRRSWTEANPNDYLKGLYRHAISTNDNLAEIQNTYADVAAEILALHQYKEGRFEAWIDHMIQRVEEGPGIPLNSSNSNAAVQGQSRVRIDRNTIDEGYLSTLYSRFKIIRNRLIRYDADWQKLLYEASKSEDIIQSRNSHSLEFRYKRSPLPPKAAYMYYHVVQPYLQRGLAAIFLALSVILVWSEITHGTIVSIVNIIVSHTYGLWQQLMSSIFLGFMCAAAFSSLSRIRVFKVYALVHRHSDPSSMLWYAMYACRLTVPLSFNYITLISSRDSVFEEFLGKFINLTPLGKYFNDWLPRFVLVPMIFTLFHVYDRVKDFLGFGLSFDDEEDEETGERGSVVEGRELVKRSLTDASYRYSIRHPNVGKTTGSGSNTPQLPDDPFPSNRQQPPTTFARAYHDNSTDSLLSTTNENRNLPEESTTNSNKPGFLTNLGNKMQSTFQNFRLPGTNSNRGNNILPVWNDSPSTGYQDESDEDEQLII